MFDAERPGLIPHVGPFDHCPAGDGEAIRREGASTLSLIHISEPTRLQ